MKINFKVTCPGCGHEFGILTRKPGLLVPLTANRKCPACESTVIYKIKKTGAIKNNKEVSVTHVYFKPSEMFLEALSMAEQEKQKESLNEILSSNVNDNDATENAG